MKKLIAAVLVSCSVLFGTGCTYVPAGNVGVKVHLLGGDKGVDSEEVGPGRYFLTLNEEMYLFPTFTQNYTWSEQNNESLSFQTVEGMSVGADVGISYSIDASKVTSIFQKYRKGVEEITDIYLRNMVRDALVIEASTMPIETVYGKGKADLIAATEVRVRKQVADIGINIEHIYWIGDLRLPNTVVASINAKIAATQKAQQRENEVAQAKAEADKKIEEARGEAESLRLKRQEITDNLLKLKELEVQQEMIDKWDGRLPQTVAGDLPFILKKQVN